MTNEWGEPVSGGSTIHDFETEPVLIGTLRRVDNVETVNGESLIYRFLDDDSAQVDCWGSFDLNAKMDRVEEGSRVRIQFLGRQQTKSGNEMKVFEVRVAQRGHSVKVNPPDDDIPF